MNNNDCLYVCPACGYVYNLNESNHKSLRANEVCPHCHIVRIDNFYPLRDLLNNMLSEIDDYNSEPPPIPSPPIPSINAPKYPQYDNDDNNDGDDDPGASCKPNFSL